jgi:predicted O-methyltransferase YrrM
MPSLLNDPGLETLLDLLHSRSEAQEEESDAYYERREREGTLDKSYTFDQDMHRFFADKLVALDRDKAQFCYQLCRSLRASCIVEAGTSFGVSTLYLAAAIRDNQSEGGVVIGTEHEPAKAEIARANFAEAGLSDFIDLRERDLRQGAVVVCDNTTVDAAEYRDYFEFINAPKNRFRTMTLPFTGGFEFTVRI